jgi:demethylmenaquinone methyltransferase/2-methoxy-6-polyprenyl-1,4-benzoquinol methylase
VADATLDGAMVGFGVRNLASVEAGLLELARVLRPGAPLVVLEFTLPRSGPLRWLYLLYFRQVLPRIGRALSKHPTAYSYLPASVLDFPDGAGFARMMQSAGFEPVEWQTRTGGVVAIHLGLKRAGAEPPMERDSSLAASRPA